MVLRWCYDHHHLHQDDSGVTMVKAITITLMVATIALMVASNMVIVVTNMVTVMTEMVMVITIRLISYQEQKP